MAEFDTSLILTTPHLRGKRVKDAQWLLAGHNRFSTRKVPEQIHPYHGRLDGEYGPVCAEATKRAKYWLGYPTKSLNYSFGQTIYDYLTKTTLPEDFQHRRADRIKALKNTVPLKAFKLAESQIGTKEKPFGSNRTKYGEWYGFNGVAWCAIFVSWCLSHSGWNWKYSYVPEIARMATLGLHHMHLTFTPKRGDLVTYITGEGPDMHIAFFDRWIGVGQHQFYDLGGNTGPTNMSNGGCVMRQIRYRGMVNHFITLV
jgi:hypothetical protein